MGRGRRLLGMAAILCGLVLMILWEWYGKGALLYEEIPVLREDLQKGQVLEASMVDYVRLEWPGDHLTEEEVESYLGKEAVQRIRRETPLYPEDFADPQMVGDSQRGTYTVSLPSSAMENHWGRVQLGDRLFLYRGKERIAMVYVAGIQEETGALDVITDEEGLEAISNALFGGGGLLVARG